MPLFERAAGCFMEGLRLDRSAVRLDVFTFLHRLAAIMGLRFAPVLPRVLELIVANASSQMEMLGKFTSLCNQLVTRHREAMLPYLVGVLPPFLAALIANLRTPLDDSDQNARVEMEELRRTFFTFIHTITASNCAPALVAAETLPCLQDLLNMVTAGCEGLDHQSQKLSVLILRRLTQQWLQPQGSVLPGFVEFLFSQALPATMRGIFQRGFNVTDAQAWLVLLEVAILLRTLLDKTGLSMLEYLNAILQSLSLHPSLVGELLDGIQRPESPQDRAAFAKLLKSIITRSRL